MVTVIRESEVDRDGTAALVIGDHAALGRARSSVPAGRAIGHVVDDVQIGLLGCRHVQVSDRETTVLPAAREGRRRRALVLVRSAIDAFFLERK